jgi:hypothetical protein
VAAVGGRPRAASGTRRRTCFEAPKPTPTLPLRVDCVRKVSPSAAAIPQIAKNRKNPKSADKPGSVTALARYGRHSSRRTVAGTLEPPTRGLGEQRHRPPTWCCSGWRLPRFTRRGVTRGDSSLWPCSSPSSTALTATYRGRALPGIPLCGARTFLPPVSRAATVWLASDGKDSANGMGGAGESADAPMHGFAGPQRHDTVPAIRILGRHRP